MSNGARKMRQVTIGELNESLGSGLYNELAHDVTSTALFQRVHDVAQSQAVSFADMWPDAAGLDELIDAIEQSVRGVQEHRSVLQAGSEAGH